MDVYGLVQVLKLVSAAEAAVDELFLLIRIEESLSTADSERITKLSLICSVLNMNMIPKPSSYTQVHTVEKSAKNSKSTEFSSFCFCNFKIRWVVPLTQH